MKNKVRIFNCLGCGIKVEKSCLKSVKFCSIKCYQSNKGRMGLIKKKGENKNCVNCNNIYYVPVHRISKSNFCSTNCFNIFQSNKIIIKCIICGNEKKLSPSLKNQKYCSISCRDKDPQVKLKLIEMNLEQNKNKKSNKNELLGYDCLNECGFPYLSQHLLFNKFCVDAYIPKYKTVVQFDGDYWHGNKEKYDNFDKRQLKRMALDISQDAYFKKMGISVIRVWESELKSDPIAFTERVKKHVSQLSLFAPEELTQKPESLFD